MLLRSEVLVEKGNDRSEVPLVTTERVLQQYTRELQGSPRVSFCCFQVGILLSIKHVCD